MEKRNSLYHSKIYKISLKHKRVRIEPKINDKDQLRPTKINKNAV